MDLVKISYFTKRYSFKNVIINAYHVQRTYSVQWIYISKQQKKSYSEDFFSVNTGMNLPIVIMTLHPQSECCKHFPFIKKMKNELSLQMNTGKGGG